MERFDGCNGGPRQCLERCPSVGFMAAMEFGDCRASCERRRSASNAAQHMTGDVPTSLYAKESIPRQAGHAIDDFAKLER